MPHQMSGKILQMPGNNGGWGQQGEGGVVGGEGGTGGKEKMKVSGGGSGR